MAALLLRTHALSPIEKPKPTLRRPSGGADQLVLQELQPWLRGAGEFLRPCHGAADPHGGGGAGRLCRPAVPDRQPADLDADRPDPAARPLLLHRSDAAAARRDPRTRRPAGAPGVGADHGHARGAERRGLRRLRRRHLHQCAQHRRDLRAAETVRRAAQHPQGKDPRGLARQNVLAARGLRVSCSSRPRCRASAPAAASRATSRTAPRAACRRSKPRPGRSLVRPGRRRA